MKNPSDDTGAAAELRFLEKRALEKRQRIAELDKSLSEAIRKRDQRPPELDGIDFDKEVRLAERNLADAETAHASCIRQLRDFDKQVDPSRREGEKIMRADVELIIEQLTRYQRLAWESLLLTLSQESSLCESPIKACIIAKPKLAEAFTLSINNAVRENHLPLWAHAAVERGS